MFVEPKVRKTVAGFTPGERYPLSLRLSRSLVNRATLLANDAGCSVPHVLRAAIDAWGGRRSVESRYFPDRHPPDAFMQSYVVSMTQVKRLRKYAKEHKCSINGLASALLERYVSARVPLD